MKKIALIAMLLVCAISFAQIEVTSFEEPSTFIGLYTDTGDPNVAHDLVNNPNEPILNYTSTGVELGFNARYEPYDTPGDGLSDGDEVGVTENPPNGSNPFPDGAKGYQISDIDGNYILEFDPVMSSTSIGFSIDYFVSETGYEGDGTDNIAGSDRLRIFIRDLTKPLEIDLLNTTGSDINDVLVGGVPIEGSWFTADIEINDLTIDDEFQLVIEARNNSSAEVFFFDNIRIYSILGLNDESQNPFYIYPNPTSKGYVSISSNSTGEKDIRVFNILGQQIINTKILNDKLNITSFSSGVYIIKITQGNHSTTKKIVVN